MIHLAIPYMGRARNLVEVLRIVLQVATHNANTRTNWWKLYHLDVMKGHPTLVVILPDDSLPITCNFTAHGTDLRSLLTAVSHFILS